MKAKSSKSELQSKAHLVSTIQTHKTGVSLGGWPPGMVFFFPNFAMSSLVERRIVPQPRIKPEPPL